MNKRIKRPPNIETKWRVVEEHDFLEKYFLNKRAKGTAVNCETRKFVWSRGNEIVSAKDWKR